MRTIFYATTVTALIAAIAACSDSTPANDAGPGPQVCPVTIVEATATPTADAGEGASDVCHVAGYICVVGFQCGNFTQQATCTCDALTKAFSCKLANNTPVAQGTTEADIPTLCSKTGGTQPDPCPTDKTKADGTACTNAGQVCTYTTTCTSSPPPQDLCQCKGVVSGDAGLAWSCELNQCP